VETVGVCVSVDVFVGACGEDVGGNGRLNEEKKKKKTFDQVHKSVMKGVDSLAAAGM